MLEDDKKKMFGLDKHHKLKNFKKIFFSNIIDIIFILIYNLLHKRNGIGGFKAKDKTGYWCSDEINKNNALENTFLI